MGISYLSNFVVFKSLHTKSGVASLSKVWSNNGSETVIKTCYIQTYMRGNTDTKQANLDLTLRVLYLLRLYRIFSHLQYLLNKNQCSLWTLNPLFYWQQNFSQLNIIKKKYLNCLSVCLCSRLHGSDCPLWSGPRT